MLFATAACIFDIGTKSAPDYVFQHFHCQMCFSPQQRAFFRRVKSKKCFGADVLCTFSLQNVLFATAACIFSTEQKVLRNVFCTFSLQKSASTFPELTKVLRTRHVLYIFTSECAFRHSGVQFLISPLSSDLRTRRFNRPTFRLTRHTNH